MQLAVKHISKIFDFILSINKILLNKLNHLKVARQAQEVVFYSFF